MLFAKLTVTMNFETALPVVGTSREEADAILEAAGKESLIAELRANYEELLAVDNAKLISLTGTIEVIEV